MHHTTERASQILNEVGNILALDEPSNLKLRRLGYTLAFIQCCDLARTLKTMIPHEVYSGPFKGMKLTPAAMTGAFCPILLGTYEHELHPVFEKVIQTPYKKILNIGCAFGYYSVGLALRMPQVTVHSFDTDVGEQGRCREMVELNGVQDRVIISGLFEGEKFADYGSDTLLLMDIEGGEVDLLDPAKYPALQKMDVIVELHDLLRNDISKLISERFAATHEMELVLNKGALFDFTPIIGPGRYVDPMDSLLANWENRDGPTPWGVFRAKSK